MRKPAAEQAAEISDLSYGKQEMKRVGFMKKRKSLFLKLTALSLTVLMWLGSISVVSAENRVITGFGDFDIGAHYLRVDAENRPSEEELLKLMPETLDVYFNGSETSVSVPVTWYCITEDYLTTTDHYVQFSPVFEEETAEYVDILRDAPYIGVFLEEISDNEESLNGAASTGRAVSESPYEEKIYAYLTENLGFGAAAACGIMANIQCECSFYPNNLQTIGNRKLNMTDEEYTAAVDNGSYARETFTRDSYGYGLMQWTWWSRKQNLYDYAKARGVSISDYKMQLDFMNQELQGYTTLKATLNSVSSSAKGAYDSAYAWCKIYEQPSDTEARSIQRGNLARDLYWPHYGSGNAAVTTERIAGKSRYLTAMAAADRLLELEERESFDTIVLACGSNFPDALSGVTLACQYEAPMLLVGSSAEETGTWLTLNYVKSHLISNGRIFILGADGVVSDETERELEDSGYEVIRLAGSNRYQTNLKVIDELKVTEGSDIYIASGRGFADALSVSGYAAADEAPVFLTSDSLTAEALDKIAAIKPAHIYLMGGTAAVSETVEKQLKGYHITRLKGNNRYETAKAAAETLADHEASGAVITTGDNFPDGLVAGVLAARMNVPILLVSDYHVKEAYAYLEEYGISHYYVMGESGAVSNEVVNGLRY